MGDSLKYIAWFREIQKEDIPTVGGKGANLGEMTNSGFPVPPGFAVTVKTFEKFMEESDLKKKIIEIIDNIDVDNTEELEKKTKEVRQLILNKPISMELQAAILKAYHQLSERRIGWLQSTENEFVAVRSSATAEDLPEASFAGQQDTYLNIIGDRRVLDAVKKCWASLFTARATYYRKKNDFKTEEVGISVIVQKMINPEVAGVMFTADPTGDESKMMIEAGYGLGESVVSGSITPDVYILDKGSVKITDKKISKQEMMHVRKAGTTCEERVKSSAQSRQKLKDSLIIELAKIGKQIERHYGHPQDIEWAIEENEIYIIQTRAITTLEIGKEKSKEKMDIDATSLIEGLGASPGIASGKIRVIPSIKDIEKVEEGIILVTQMTTPDWVPIMKKSAGIITDEGGSTCHAAIVSRELGIPCVVGTGRGTKFFKDNQIVTVDGFNGRVYEGMIEIKKPEEEKREIIKEDEIESLKEILKDELRKRGIEETSLSEEEKQALAVKAKEEHTSEEEINKEREALEEILKKTAIKVKVNVAIPSAAEKAAATGADGVGLLRAEHMITATGMHPMKLVREGKKQELVEIVKEGIKGVVKHFPGKPVWYRTFDARTDEFRNLQGGEDEPEEDNPMLGWHGIRRSLDIPELIKAEFKAIKELVKEGHTNIGVMIPFVQSVEELKKAKSYARSEGLQPHQDVEFGIMIETPASVWIIDELLKEGLDFVSFGTNDLTQLTLGIDRNNERLAKLFDEKHPAVLREIKHVINKCRMENITTSICGQAGSDPKMIKKLVKWGIRSVSANIDAVQNAKETVLIEEKKMIMDKLQ